ncbi:hypothetical protein D3C85_958830 [compost metagenome]
MKKIIAAVAFLLTTVVHAEEMVFYERPSFMAESMPLKIECKFVQAYTFTCFEKYELPGMVNAKVVNTSGGNLRVHQVPTTYVASCSQGMCVSQRDQTPVGDVDFAALQGHSFIAQTFDGYYLDKDDKEHLVAYKRGFGPKADQYPPYAIFKEPVQRMSSNTSKDTYDVICLPNSDTCRFKDQQVDRSELSKLIPKKSSKWCDTEFCYATEFFEGVVGINPDGSL